MLKVPVIVASSDAILSYDDIAIVEEGEPNTVFGDEQFWDYVVVEGSNGGDWQVLTDGYDARAFDEWLTAYRGSGAGNSSMFKTHDIDLLDTYSPGDTVVIRFRLHADELTTGWGWAIDNISIQPTLVGIKDVAMVPGKFVLSQNYPNPFNPTTTLRFSLENNEPVTLQIFDNMGRIIRTLYNNQKLTSSAVHEVQWDGKNEVGKNIASGTYYYRLKSGKNIAVKKMVLIR